MRLLEPGLLQLLQCLGVKLESQKPSLVRCVSVGSCHDRVAEYSSPTHNNLDKNTKTQHFKNSNKTTFGVSVESGKSQYQEVNLHLLTSQELEDHLEGLRNTVRRLQHSQCNFKPVDEETDISCA